MIFPPLSTKTANKLRLSSEAMTISSGICPISVSLGALSRRMTRAGSPFFIIKGTLATPCTKLKNPSAEGMGSTSTVAKGVSKALEK